MEKKIKQLIEQDGLASKSQKQKHVHQRHYLFYLLRERVGMTQEAIGELFNRDHATVLHGVKMHKTREEMKDPYMNRDIAQYKELLEDDNLLQIN
jgi:chromosomal replication initiation ATPase DnaA